MADLTPEELAEDEAAISAMHQGWGQQLAAVGAVSAVLLLVGGCQGAKFQDNLNNPPLTPVVTTDGADMDQTYGNHARQPGWVTFARWVLACLNTWLLGATGGRHERPEVVLARPESGADPQWGDTLHAWNAEAPQSVPDAETDHLYDLLDSADQLAPLDASYRAHAEAIQAAVDLASAGGAR